jgi:hypothetical protein
LRAASDGSIIRSVIRFKHRHVPGRTLRRFAVVGGVATLAAISYVAIASAWVQPVTVTVDASHHRPEAGTVFTALAIQTNNVPAGCPQGTVGHRSITPVQAIFGAFNITVCSYQIPPRTVGRELLLANPAAVAPLKWRIIPRP